MKIKPWILLLSVLIILVLAGNWVIKTYDFNSNYEIGQEIDHLNGVKVYYNGRISNVKERNTTKDGYNLGLKYQCVEFVKRYYYEKLNHKMPNSYGNAKDFFDMSIQNGHKNVDRDLLQYRNDSKTKPEINDLLIYKGSIFNKFGHVAIISNVSESEIEIIQQNPGPFGQSRETYSLSYKNDKWRIGNDRILGWLRK